MKLGILKRAIINLKRNNRKYFILLTVIISIGVFMSGSILIVHSIQQTQNNFWNQLPSLVSLDYDFVRSAELKSQNFDNEPNELTIEVIEEIKNHSYVRTFEATLDMEVLSNLQWPDNSFWDEELAEQELNLTSIRGIYNHEVLEIQEGMLQLIAGRTFNPNEISNTSENQVAIISSEMAEYNNLMVGSTFNLTHLDGGAPIDYSEENILERQDFEIKIVGIFELNITPNSGDFEEDSFLKNLWNGFIYLPLPFVESLHAVKDEMTEFEPGLINHDFHFVLYDTSLIPSFRNEVSHLIPEPFTLVTFSDILGHVAAFEGAMSNVNFFAALIIWSSAIATILIVSLFLILSLHDRKQGIGIYLSLGERKIKIIMQILIETIIPILSGVTIALFLGNFLAEYISRNLIIQELTSSQAEQHQNRMFFNNGFYSMFLDNHISSALSTYEMSLTGSQVVLFYTLAISISILSIGFALLFLMRLNPKDILLKQAK